jgi:hypothetical protein
MTTENEESPLLRLFIRKLLVKADREELACSDLNCGD